MEEREKLLVKEKLKKAKKGQHKCNDPNCFITRALPLLGLEGSFNYVLELVCFCYEQKQTLESRGVQFVIEGEVPSLDDERTMRGAEEALKRFGQNIKEDSSMKKVWLSLMKASSGNREAIIALLFFASFFVLIERGYQVVEAIDFMFAANNN